MQLRLHKKPSDYKVQREQNTYLVMSDGCLDFPERLLHLQEKEHFIRQSENNEKRRSHHITKSKTLIKSKSKTYHEQNGCKVDHLSLPLPLSVHYPFLLLLSLLISFPTCLCFVLRVGFWHGLVSCLSINKNVLWFIITFLRFLQLVNSYSYQCILGSTRF